MEHPLEPGCAQELPRPGTAPPGEEPPKIHSCPSAYGSWNGRFGAVCHPKPTQLQDLGVFSTLNPRGLDFVGVTHPKAPLNCRFWVVFHPQSKGGVWQPPKPLPCPPQGPGQFPAGNPSRAVPPGLFLVSPGTIWGQLAPSPCPPRAAQGGTEPLPHFCPPPRKRLRSQRLKQTRENLGESPENSRLAEVREWEQGLGLFGMDPGAPPSSGISVDNIHRLIRH